VSHRDASQEPGGADEISAARDALDGEHEPLDTPRDRAVPNLPSRDFDATVAFYGGFGFGVEHRDGGWLILRRGGVLLEFFLAPELDPYASWFMASVRIADLEGLYAAVRASGVPEAVTGIPRLVPVALQEWGQRAGFLIDLDGTQLHLIENQTTTRAKASSLMP
jgi:catechol 2,3-dioxygenase-like lactoylglutathione lyase family enzyme